MIMNFWDKVLIDDEDKCWEWIDGKTSAGYGRFYIKEYTQIYSHRYSYEFYNGEIPEGLLVCHSCDNPSCVNPTHLFLGTDFDNALDKMNKNRQAKGTDLPQSKLSEKSIVLLRGLYNNGYKQGELSHLFEVNQSTISRALNRKTWKHI